MKHFLLALAYLIPSACLGQTAFVDPHNGVQIKTDLSGLQYGGSRTVYFDDDGTIETNLPPDVGYIYIYNAQTRKGVIEFSRGDNYRPYLFDYSRHSRYRGRYHQYHRYR